MILALLLSVSPPTAINETVSVDDSRYRVRVRGEEVVIFTKQPFRGRTTKERDRMRAAVKTATGCKLQDDFWRDNRLVGTLLCGEQ